MLLHARYLPYVYSHVFPPSLLGGIVTAKQWPNQPMIDPESIPAFNGAV